MQFSFEGGGSQPKASVKPADVAHTHTEDFNQDACGKVFIPGSYALVCI